MNYNEWKNNNPNGTVREYLAECQKNEQVGLRYPDLSEADLRYPDLSEADLRYTDLRGANLIMADLSMADLREANLRGANLSMADLRGADLRGADLSMADLRGADLRGADLRGGDLSEANLRGANLSEAVGPFTVGAFGRHTAVAAGGYIAIGCERHPYEAWLTQYKEIGRKHGYTADEIADYGAWIKLAVARQRRIEQAD